jgi:hypothetical protein
MAMSIEDERLSLTVAVGDLDPATRYVMKML